MAYGVYALIVTAWLWLLAGEGILFLGAALRLAWALLEYIWRRLNGMLQAMAQGMLVIGLLLAVIYTIAHNGPPAHRALWYGEQRTLLSLVANHLEPFQEGVFADIIGAPFNDFERMLSGYLTERERLSQTVGDLRDVHVPEWVEQPQGQEERQKVNRAYHDLLHQQTQCDSWHDGLMHADGSLMRGLEAIWAATEASKSRGRELQGRLSGGFAAVVQSLDDDSVAVVRHRVANATLSVRELRTDYFQTPDPCMRELVARVSRDLRQAVSGLRGGHMGVEERTKLAKAREEWKG